MKIIVRKNSLPIGSSMLLDDAYFYHFVFYYSLFSEVKSVVTVNWLMQD